MSDFIKQCKGVDADKLNISDDEMFYSSIKYDGVYIQIHKAGDIVQFFTSSGKEFGYSHSKEFEKFDFDFKIECEYICDGGKLGARFKADNEIKKVVKDSSFLLTGEFKVFDILNSELVFSKRVEMLPMFGSMAVEYELSSFLAAKTILPVYSKNGTEGLFLKKPAHINLAAKKSKDAVKLKMKYTADLVCIGFDGNFLLLQGDDGLNTKVSASAMIEYISIGDVIEIEYEQIVKTYVNTTFRCIRHDKV